MHQQPGDRSCANEAIGGDHWGPIMAYMAKVDDATTAVGSSASWFKISEMGLPSNNPEYWATEVLNDNCGHFTFTIPDVEPGQYLLRAEVIGRLPRIHHTISYRLVIIILNHVVSAARGKLCRWCTILYVLLPSERWRFRNCKPPNSQNSRSI